MSKRAADVAAIAAVHAIACALALALGFDHVSDDDFARVTIAQSFAHAPKLDPTGTSWLPFPFWIMGSAMAVLGRTLAVARVTNIALSSVALAFPYLALRATGRSRACALAATAFAAASPWSVWLGAATVPESFTASFTAAAAIALGARGAFGVEATSIAGTRARPWFSALLLAACLSRYEAWPVAAVLAVHIASQRLTRTRGARQLPRQGEALAYALVVLGPLAWMAWNARVHGSALHFLARVSTFKRNLGAGSTDVVSGLALYPRLLLTVRPDVVAAAVGALVTLRHEDVRQRWAVPLACAVAQIAFLAYGNATDGAPAHHPERALLPSFFILAAFAADVLVEAGVRCASARPALALAAALSLATCWVTGTRATLQEVPGTSTSEDRTAQLAEGAKLRATGAEHISVTPCAFEHFALIAAYAAPERVETNPRTGAAVGGGCPRVERQ